MGVKVRKETAVDADGLLGVPGGVEEVRVGQVGDDLFGCYPGGVAVNGDDAAVVG